jgi:hypothetical protein
MLPPMLCPVKTISAGEWLSTPFFIPVITLILMPWYNAQNPEWTAPRPDG